MGVEDTTQLSNQLNKINVYYLALTFVSFSCQINQYHAYKIFHVSEFQQISTVYSTGT